MLLFLFFVVVVCFGERRTTYNLFRNTKRFVSRSVRLRETESLVEKREGDDGVTYKEFSTCMAQESTMTDMYLRRVKDFVRASEVKKNIRC